MKTGIVAALLVLGALAPMTTALADHSTEHTAVLLVTSVANCFGVGPDGQPDRVRNVWLNVDVLYQKPGNACA
ncbi:MAG TPA: hypothetical protein VNX21_03255 [Candidatus Thermoplasmatota archaeon]|nr:hypothetical protein [Candidatus Thermoplasmatota archaeon]